MKGAKYTKRGDRYVTMKLKLSHHVSHRAQTDTQMWLFKKKTTKQSMK